MPPVAKNKKVHYDREIQNPSADFDALNYPEEKINTYDAGDKSERESDVVGNMAKGQSQNRGNKKAKHIKSSKKTNILTR